MKSIGFIGTGNLGSSIIPKLIQKNIVSNKELYMYDVNKETLSNLKSKYHTQITESLEELTSKSDIIFLTIKPFILKEILIKLKDILKDKIIISTAAGVTTNSILSVLYPTSKVVRTMPNLGAKTGNSMTAYYTVNLSKDEENFIKAVLLSFGETISLEEKSFNSFTSLCGSSPAFFAYIANSFVQYGKDNGYDEETVTKMVLYTMYSTSKLLLSENMKPSTLIDLVATKGGTTEAGLSVLENSKINKEIYETLHATTVKGTFLNNK